jgi:hypothetical protein
MHRAADYLKRAEEAEAKAAAGSGAFRTQMQAIAAQWREMARHADEARSWDAAAKRLDD